MRIITGTAKGTRLFTPAGDDVRPTTEMAKEGVFSAIQFDLEGAVFLDLFAGSGQMGLEALSRGAAEATFVDSSEASIALVRKNAEKCRMTPRCRIVRSEYGEFIKSVSRRGKKYDFIFADPPYGKDLAPELFKRVIKADLVKPGGLLILETGNPELDMEKVPEEVRERVAGIKSYRFSKSIFFFIRLKGEEE